MRRIDSQTVTPVAQRPGFTLLEVMLAMSIAVVLLGALYVSVNEQLVHTQVGRDLVQQSTLSRSLFARIGNDVSAAVNLADSSRLRLQNSNGGGGGSGGGNSTAAATTSTNSNATSSPSNDQTGTTVAITFPYGIQGDSGQMNLYLSKYPREDFVPLGADVPPPVSDLRRITYWLAPGGLARQEVKIITSQDITEEAYQIMAPEVLSLTFSYFDGTDWQDSWDSTTMGADGVTPIGPPRLVAITIGLVNPSGSDGDSIVRRHVVPIATANGTTSSTSTQTSGGGTSP